MINVGKQPIVVGRLYHMVGELELTPWRGGGDGADGGGARGLQLPARVACDAHDLDPELYVRALELQRTRPGL